MKNILVTGGLGFIGSVTCSLLLKKGFNIIIIDNNHVRNRDNLDNLLLISSNIKRKLFLYDYDLKNLKETNSVFSDHNIDGVIHFAALKSVPDSMKDPFEYYSNNILGSLNLFNAMVKHNVKQIVFSSSAAIYSPENTYPIKEDSKIEPQNPYASSKYFIENILEDFYESHEVSSISLRYFNPIGTDELNIFGDTFDEDNKSITSSIIKTINDEQKHLEIYGRDYDTKDGTALRDFIHVQDVASAHIDALNLLFKRNKVFECINIGCGKGYTVLELVRMFKNLSGSNFEYKFCKPRKNDIPSSVADIRKAKNILKWKPHLSLDKMCEDVLKQIENGV